MLRRASGTGSTSPSSAALATQAGSPGTGPTRTLRRPSGVRSSASPAAVLQRPSRAGSATPSSKILLRVAPPVLAGSAATATAASRSPPAPQTGRLERAAKLARNRANRRLLKYSLLRATAGAKGLSLLQFARAGVRTQAYLEKELLSFEQWAVSRKIPMRDFDEVDRAVVEYLDHLFLQGAAADHGDKLLLALSHRHPEMSKGCPANPFRARAAMRGFRKLAHGLSRAPLPRQGLLAMVGAALHLKWHEFALALLLGWSAFLRLPSDLVRMVGASLVPPAPAAGVRCWGLLLYPQEVETLGKTLIHDESILLDDSDFAPLGPLLTQLKKNKLDTSPLWSFTQNQFYSMYRKCVGLALLPHEINPYQIRHGAASWAALSQSRSMAEIQERLRHRSDTSTRRYKNATRYLAELHRLPEETQQYGSLIDRDLANFMLRRRPAPPPPNVAQPTKRRKLTAAKGTPSAAARG